MKQPGGTLALSHRITIKDSEGRVKEQGEWERSRSFVANFLKILFTQYAQLNPGATVTRIDGVGDSIWYSNDASAMTIWLVGSLGIAGDDDCGIVLGTDNTAPTVNDYDLGTRITHGAEAGQLDFGPQSKTGAYSTGSNTDLILWRQFVNNSGGGITVEEIGVYVVHDRASDKVMIIRDAKQFTIDDGDVALVAYRFRTTV